MTRHFMLNATRETLHWGHFDSALPDVLTIRPGDVVTIDTISGDAAILPDDPAMTILDDHRAVLAHMPAGDGPHFMTGPIHVEGAEPGDTLKVEILDVRLRQNWGWNAIGPLFGTLQDEFQDLTLIHMAIDIDAGIVRMPWGLVFAAQPFFGVMGVKPPPAWGRVPSIIPRAFGGNLDNKDLVAGTMLHLPVFNPGAGFSVGDGHARQGNGEVSGTPVETALGGTFRFTLEKNTGLAQPFAETPTHFIAMGIDEDLDNAARQALREMIAFVVARSNRTRAEAYALCSILGDLAVTQTIDVNKGIHMLLPRSALAA